MAQKQKTQAADFDEEYEGQQHWYYKKVGRKFYVYDENGLLVCGDIGVEEDARLIAKAPQLLDEIEDLVRQFPEFETDAELSGADAVDYLASYHYSRKSILEEAVGKKLVLNEDKNYAFIE